MSRFISVRVKKLTDTKYARVTPYWMASSVKEGNGGGTRKFWTTTPIMYASKKKKKKIAYTRTILFSLDLSPCLILVFAYLRNHTQPKERKNAKIVRATNPRCPYCS
jgi:hypothetical protein